MLRRIFNNSVWSAVTFNLGPQTFTFGHRDLLNLLYGLCAITALGDFDPEEGGHIILWDLGIMVEFPPGTSALIPSSWCRHSNSSIGINETRMSITQYTAGGLFRWVEYGYTTAKNFWASTTNWFAQELERDKMLTRMSKGIALLSTIDELRSRGRST
jgi:hypothetical protein